MRKNTPATQSLKLKVLRLLETNPGWGRLKIARKLGISPDRVKHALECIKAAKNAADEASVDSPTGESLEDQTTEQNREITSRSSRIKTPDELLKASKVDLNVWRVKSHRVKTWEVTMREPATTVGGRGDDAEISHGKNGEKSTLWTRGSHNPVTVTMYAVSVVLEAKTPAELSLQKTLDLITERRPLLPYVKIPKDGPLGPLELELGILDPHIGLVCNYPEADGPWDLPLAANMIMIALERLIERSRSFGPFRKVFAAIGNDWSHVDTVLHTTTAGTPQPEAVSWHAMFPYAEDVALRMVDRLRRIAPVELYEVPGNHSRQADFTLGRLIRAAYRRDEQVKIDASSRPYKFHKAGNNLIGFEHGHSVKPIRLASLMANEVPDWWAETKDGIREWHLGDQHRKISAKPSTAEEQGVSVEYSPGLVVANEWHVIKAFSHQQRGAVAWVWSHKFGCIGRFQFNISKANHQPMGEHHKSLERSSNLPCLE